MTTLRWLSEQLMGALPGAVAKPSPKHVRVTIGDAETDARYDIHAVTRDKDGTLVIWPADPPPQGDLL